MALPEGGSSVGQTGRIKGSMVVRVREKRFYHWSGRRFSPEVFGNQLGELINEVRRRTGKEKVIYLCIGSDRSTGDSLGPLVGHQLCRVRPDYRNTTNTMIIGTLKEPVHAINLRKTLEIIRRYYRDALVVAVDASVGCEKNVGGITLGIGSIRPGMGVRKRLDEVGDIYITGIVYGGSHPEPEILQSTRLSLVMEMAECICSGIVETFC